MFVFKAAVVGDAELAEALALPLLNLGELGDVDFVISGGDAAEFAALDAATPGHAILASSSRDSVTDLGEATLRPDKVVGFRFFPPRLVEIVEGDETAPATVQAAANFAQSLRKTAVRCADVPGFLVEPLQAAGDVFAVACGLLDAGVASMRDIDVAAGGEPFAAADARGLDVALADFDDPPVVLRRLVAAGRLGVTSGQGFYPYPPEAGGPVRLDLRGDVAVLWLDNPPANSLSPAVVEALAAAWLAIQGEVRALILASANRALFSAGADIKAFTKWDAESGRAHLERIQLLGREWERSSVLTIAAINGLAFGGGCEIAMACDVRLAAESATFGQPEINLGIIPGFGGTQRLARLVGPAKALEMNTLGEPISASEAFEYGLVNRVVEDHELFDTALAFARKAARQAPLALGEIKRVSANAELDAGLAAERDAFMRAFATEDAREGIAAFIEKRSPEFRGS